MNTLPIWIFLVVEVSIENHNPASQHTHPIHGSWFGIGDGTVILWPLIWTLLPIGIFAILALLWAAKNGQFKYSQEIAERQLEIED